MSREIDAERIGHMIEDIDRVGQFVGSMTREEFLGDLKTIYAVTSAFIRLGEAANSIAEQTRRDYPEIEWGDIRHFRNFLIHVYDKVDASHLWEAITGDLQPLRGKLEAALRKLAGQ